MNSEQKRELEEWYRIKTEEVEKEVAKEREFQRVSNTGLSAEESANMRQAHQNSQLEYVELQRRHGELGARLRELEELLEQSKSENLMHLADRDREIQLLREKISELMATYDELMSRKTSLEFEINTYRRLLECEETRIKTNAPSSSSSSSSKHYTTIRTTETTQSSSSSSSASAAASAINASNVSAGNTIGNIIAQSAQQSAQAVQQQQVRGPSAEIASETITKRMQVQRTSKGNLTEE